MSNVQYLGVGVYTRILRVRKLGLQRLSPEPPFSPVVSHSSSTSKNMSTPVLHPSTPVRVKQEPLSRAAEHERLMTDLFGEDASVMSAFQEHTASPVPTTNPDEPSNLALVQRCQKLARRTQQLEDGCGDTHHLIQTLTSTLELLQRRTTATQERSDLLQRRSDARAEAVQLQLEKLCRQVEVANKGHEAVALVQQYNESVAAQVDLLMAHQHSYTDMLNSYRDDLHALRVQLRAHVRESRYHTQPTAPASALAGPIRSSSSMSRRASRSPYAAPKPPSPTGQMTLMQLATVCGAPQSAAAVNSHCRRPWEGCRFASHHCWRRDQGLAHLDTERCSAHPPVLAATCQRCLPSSSSPSQ